MKTKSSVSGFLFVVFVLGLLAGCKTTHVGAQDNDGAAPIVAKTAVVGSFYLRSWIYDGGARFGKLDGVAMDKAGNLYVADSGEHLIHKISPKGEVSTFAGSEEGFADGLKGAAQFRWPDGIVIDAAGNLYVADRVNDCIRKITPAGEVSTIAGNGTRGFADGRGSDAQFLWPHDIVADAAGNLYVADTNNNRIRKITPKGDVSTLAGSEGGFADGTGSAAQFHSPQGIAIDATGNLYVADSCNNRIRKITPRGEVSTLAGSEEGFADGTGSAAQFSYPNGISTDAAGNLYVADSSNNRIRMVTPAGEVCTLAGSMKGFVDGPGDGAQFHMPSGVAIDAAGNLYVADSFNNRIRKIEPLKMMFPFSILYSLLSRLLGFLERRTQKLEKALAEYEDEDENVDVDDDDIDDQESAVWFHSPHGIAVDAAGNLYVADTFNNRICKITPTGETSVLAGGTEGFADGQGSDAQFDFPSGIAIDTAGNLYVTDEDNHRIRKITPNGKVSTLAGSSGSTGFDSEGGFADGQGSAAQFSHPSDIAIDATGNLYVADSMNHCIRKVTPMGEVSTFAGRGATGREEGGFADGNDARFNFPRAIAIGATGDLYVADAWNFSIRRITPNGEVSTLAGNGTAGDADGTGSAAQFGSPSSIAIDAAGNLYVAEARDNRRIRKVTPAGEVSTFAGSGTDGDADGTGSAAQFGSPSGITIDATGNLFVTDENRIRKVTPSGKVSTLFDGFTGGFADNTGDAALFGKPLDIVMDATGDLYVADTENHRILKITPKGEVSIFAGSGTAGNVDGPASIARFKNPSGIVMDAAGNLFVADEGNYCIRKISPNGEVGTLAGSTEGFADGRGSAAQFHKPHGIAIDAAGNLYVTEETYRCIRKVTPTGEVSTFVGNDEQDDDADENAVRFCSPGAIVADAAGNLYVADRLNYRICKVTPAGGVSVLAGSGKDGYADGIGSVARFGFSGPHGIAVDAEGNLYVADEYNNSIRKVAPTGEVSTLAGGSESGNVDGRGSAAQFDKPTGITIDAAGNLYVADSWNDSIRKVTLKGKVSTFVSGTKTTDAFGYADGQGSAARFNSPVGITIDAAGNLYVADSDNERIRKITPQGEVSTLAGSGESNIVDGQGSAAQFSYPCGIAMDAAGNLYVADTRNHRIRRITPTGDVSTFAGGGRTGLKGGGFVDGQGSAARFNWPDDVAVDAAGNLYVADRDNNCIRKVTPTGEVSTFAGSGEQGDADGRGRAAQFDDPRSIVMDAAGNLYVADAGNDRIRKISPKGEVSTFVGSTEGCVDGQGSAAKFCIPSGIAIDAAGNLYVADSWNHRIRKVTPTGEVSTLAGSSKTCGFGVKGGFVDGIGCVAQFNAPFGVAVDAAGNLYVADCNNHRIRKVTPQGEVSTFAGKAVP